MCLWEQSVGLGTILAMMSAYAMQVWPDCRNVLKAVHAAADTGKKEHGCTARLAWRHKTLLSPSQVAFCTYDAYKVGKPDSRLYPWPPQPLLHASMPSHVIHVLSACIHNTQHDTASRKVCSAPCREGVY